MQSGAIVPTGRPSRRLTCLRSAMCAQNLTTQAHQYQRAHANRLPGCIDQDTAASPQTIRGPRWRAFFFFCSLRSAKAPSSGLSATFSPEIGGEGTLSGGRETNYFTRASKVIVPLAWPLRGWSSVKVRIELPSPLGSIETSPGWAASIWAVPGTYSRRGVRLSTIRTS